MAYKVGFNTYGRIVFVQHNPSQEFSVSSGEAEWYASRGLALIEVDAENYENAQSGAEHEDYYVESGMVKKRPPQPNDYYSWDWETRSWRYNPPDLGLMRKAGKETIDYAAGRARSRYITAGPGQDATYAAKYGEALAYREAGYPSDLTAYPYVAGESFPNAPRTAQEASDRIIALGDQWKYVIGPAIEATRINGKDALDDILDVNAITPHVMTVVAALDAI